MSLNNIDEYNLSNKERKGSSFNCNHLLRSRKYSNKILFEKESLCSNSLDLYKRQRSDTIDVNNDHGFFNGYEKNIMKYNFSFKKNQSRQDIEPVIEEIERKKNYLSKSFKFNINQSRKIRLPILETPQKNEKEVKLLRKKLRLDFRLELAKNAKEKIEIEEINKLREKIHLKRLKKILFNEKKKGWKCCQDFGALFTAIGLINIFAEKYKLRKKVHKNATKYFRILFVTLHTLGKIIRKIKVIRRMKAFKFIVNILKIKVSRWRKSIVIKHKRNIANYLVAVDDSYYFVQFLKEVNYGITRIQKWYRRYLAKRTLMLSIMNLLWSKLEVFSSTSKPKDPNNLAMIEEELKKSLANKRVTELVPLPIRLYYLCQVANDTHTFIKKSKMILLISKALNKKAEWDDIKSKCKDVFPIIDRKSVV